MLDTLIGSSLRYRVVVILLVLGLIGSGIYAFLNLPIEAFPDVLNEMVQVITQVPGQSAQDVERMVTIPLEREFSGIPKVIQSRSISEFGLSVVYLYFDDGVDGYWARAQVLEKIGTATLPPNISPNLGPYASVTGEVLRYEVVGPGYPLTTLRTLQDWTLEKQFRAVPGIADVTGYGGFLKTIDVTVDPLKLSTFGVSIRGLADIVTNAATNTGGNIIHWPNQSFVVRSDGEIKTLTDLENVGIVQRGQTFIRLRDVAVVKEGHMPPRGVVGRDDKDNIVQGIVLLRKGENPVTTGEYLREKMNYINSSTLLPEGVHVKKYYDRLELVSKTTKTVGANLIEGVLLVTIVLYFFLSNLPATLLVTSVVPLSMLFAFLAMKLSHTPANLISLGSIDFGIIIDGALIIVEFVLVKWASSQVTTLKTIHEWIREIVRSVFFSMVMIITAYLPIFTLQRVEGKMFSPLAWTICFALLGALIVSLTFVPAMMPTVLKLSPHHKGAEHEPPWLLKLKARYLNLLDIILSHRRRVFQVAACVAALGLCAFLFGGSEFIPELDEGALWIRATFPHSTSMEEGVKLAREIRKTLKANEEVRTVVSQLGGPEDGTDPNLMDNCEFFVDLKPREEWKHFHHKREELAEEVRRQLAEFPGISFNVSQPIADNVEEAIAGVKGKNAIKIYGPDLAILNEISSNIIAELHKINGTTDVGQVAFMPLAPLITIRIDRARVAQAGVALQDINDLVEIAVGGKKTAAVYEGETRVDVYVRADERFRDTLERIRLLPVPIPNGKVTSLEHLADVEIKSGPLAINREDGFRRIGVRFNVEGRDLGSVMSDVNKMVARLKLPAGYFLRVSGEYDNQQRAMKRLMFVVPMTLVLIAIILFLLYSRLSVVGVILMSLLLATTGSLILLTLRGIPFSVPAAVGLLVLFGLMALDSVALCSALAGLADEKKKILTSEELKELVKQAAARRFRPILMTSCLAGLGLLPAAISNGMGAETQKPLATAVIGGIFTGLPVILFFLPVLLTFLVKSFSFNKSEEEEALLVTE